MAGIKCPSKVEMDDFENSNGSYGEPPPKRSNINQSATRSQGSNNTADANITLWQFLLDLLVKQQYSNIICWTNNEGEFKLLDAEQVAKLWGLKKNKNNMNYDKLSRALRYYYDKNIIKKVIGHKFVYRFVSFPEMVKTENRIPFKKKMESIISESSTSPNSNNNGTVSSAMNGFQTLRPYDVKSGLIQQAQLAAAANMVQQQATLRHHAVTQALLEQKYQLPAEHRALYHADKSPLQNKLSSEILHSQDSRSSTPKIALHNSSIDCTEISSPSHRQSPQMSPVSVCTPDASSTPPPQFDLPVAGTPTPPPKPVTPVKNKEPEVKVKLEIPELDDNKNCNGNSLTDISSRRTSKHSKSKPDPLSISNDVVVNHSVTSPLMARSLLPGLNTPMFLTSPMFGQRTPLPLGLPFWGPGTLSPVHTLSPRIPGYGAGPAFQFPAFSSISPATLSSFGNFADTVFNISNMNNSNSDRDKKVSS